MKVPVTVFRLQYSWLHSRIVDDDAVFRVGPDDDISGMLFIIYIRGCAQCGCSSRDRIAHCSPQNSSLQSPFSRKRKHMGVVSTGKVECPSCQRAGVRQGLQALGP